MTSRSEWVTRSPLSDVEQRMGIPPLESLLAERDTLVKQAADLWARHGPGGTYDNLRKIEWTTIAASLRAKAVADQTKLTEAAIEQAAHADPRYVAFVTQATEEKARFVVLENQIQGITETVNRGQALARFLSAEVSLTPR